MVENNVDFSHLTMLDYSPRKLDICGVCRLNYNVGDRIPRILVNCGHTYCTSCLLKYYRKKRIRCPFCKKLVKNLESVELLPLNICIFSESISNNDVLLNLLDSDSEENQSSDCKLHKEKQKHFYCSSHGTNFCRECIKKFHKEENCCVVDLFDINKLFQLNNSNVVKNELIVKARNKKIKAGDEFFIANA